jgi:hypothetical protein
MGRLAYLRPSGSRFEDRCGCVYTRHTSGEAFVTPCLQHRDVIVASESCDRGCGWIWTGPPKSREEFHLCAVHLNLFLGAP